MVKLIKAWVLGSTACVSAGWVLSLLHQLNVAGYVIFFLVLGLTFAAEYQLRRRVLKMETAGLWRRAFGWRARRFRRPLPFLFLLTAGLAALGGAIHAPNNYDALTYRFPRMLHWWAAGGWHWIDTPNLRMNLSGTGFEWMMMPIFVLTQSDRFFFLLNIAGYLMLPSLIFLAFREAGLGRRASWFWMWVLPAALCYAMQAGSFSNDTVAVTYFLAAVYFALEARHSGNIRNLWLAFLAGGLLTGVKASNLPLLLPIAWAVWPALGLLRTRKLSSALVVLLAMIVSFLPMAGLNTRYTGNWGGDPANVEKVQVQKPLAGILGNSLQLGLQSLEPPFLPVARAAENWVWDRFPAELQTVLKRDFPRFVVGFREMPQEESAGLGVGVTLLALISIVAGWRFWRRHPSSPIEPRRWQGLVLGGLTWVALMAFMAKLGSESTSRLVAAYYPLLLLPLLMNRAQSFLVRRGWFQGLAIVTILISTAAVVLTPARPLWPATPFFDWAVARFPENALLSHARTVYAVYRTRNDLFALLRKSIPSSVAVIGVIEAGDDDAETSLWRPFGSRRVVHVHPDMRSQTNDPQWLVVKNSEIGTGRQADFERWMQLHSASLVCQQALQEKAGHSPEIWSVVKLASVSN
jgi:hypothetical protein